MSNSKTANTFKVTFKCFSLFMLLITLLFNFIGTDYLFAYSYDSLEGLLTCSIYFITGALFGFFGFDKEDKLSLAIIIAHVLGIVYFIYKICEKLSSFSF